LADAFGNLVSRCLNGNAPFPVDYQNKLPPIGALNENDQLLLRKLNSLKDLVTEHFDRCDFAKGIERIFAIIHETNAYFTHNQPWRLAKIIKEANLTSPSFQTTTTTMETPSKMEYHEDRLSTVMFTTLECIRIVSLLLQPIMPTSTSNILDRLAIPLEERSISYASVGMKPIGSELGNSTEDIKPFPIVE
jgi:methionyl-tRNA synthetase